MIDGHKVTVYWVLSFHVTLVTMVVAMIVVMMMVVMVGPAQGR